MIWISAAHPAPGSGRIISGVILSGNIPKKTPEFPGFKCQFPYRPWDRLPLSPRAFYVVLQPRLDELAEISARTAHAMLSDQMHPAGRCPPRR